MPYAPRRRAPRRLVRRTIRGRRIGPSRRAARRRAASVGALAVIALTCAAYLAWEFLGTTWLAHARQREALTALATAWDRQSPSTTSRGVAVDGIVRIPRFGAAYAVPLVEGTGAKSLAIGVGHVVGTAHPGDAGNFVVSGHRVTHGEPFRRLPTLQSGDEVIVETVTSDYIYRVTSAGSSLRLPDDATWVLASSPRNPDPAGTGPPPSKRLITLVTCAELFHTSDRFVVFGELVHTYPRVHAHPEA